VLEAMIGRKILDIGTPLPGETFVSSHPIRMWVDDSDLDFPGYLFCGSTMKAFWIDSENE